jgi:RNA polymerase sigma-70 factor (ECF subfamily)
MTDPWASGILEKQGRTRAWVFTDRIHNTAEDLNPVAGQSAKGHPVATLSLCDVQTSLTPEGNPAVVDAPSLTNRFTQEVETKSTKNVIALPRDKSEPKSTIGDDLDVLVSAAIDGERGAVEGVLRWIRPLVVRYCRARVGGQEKTFVSADDVAQEVCLAVLTALPGYRRQGRPFLAFVYGIAAHKVADAHRSAVRNRTEPIPAVPDTSDLADGPEARVMQNELAGRMAKLLDMLPDKQRDILVLRVVVGLSAEKTAAAVGSTPGAVRVAQHRALNRLRTVLASRDRLLTASEHGLTAPG